MQNLSNHKKMFLLVFACSVVYALIRRFPTDNIELLNISLLKWVKAGLGLLFIFGTILIYRK